MVFYYEVSMNIPEMRGMGLIPTPKFDVLLPGERLHKQPSSLEGYLRQKRIAEDAQRAANESYQRVFNKHVRGEHENSSVHNQRSL